MDTDDIFEKLEDIEYRLSKIEHNMDVLRDGLIEFGSKNSSTAGGGIGNILGMFM